MNPKFQRFLKLAIISILFSFTSPAVAHDLPARLSAPHFTADQVIAEINAYRQANGSGAMQYNGTLASLAQSHSSFMASTGMITHEEGGTSPTDRAYSAGYGNGKKIILSEIIFGGTGATVKDAMTWWKNSEIHNRVMLDGRYVEIGAGIASSGGMTYFTAEIAFITGSAAPPTSDNSSESEDLPADEESPSVFVYSPVSIAEPQEDGSVIHIVQSGQTLWTIAAVYQEDLQTILDLNQLTSGSWVFPGDEILIKPPGSAPSPTPEVESTVAENSEGHTALGTAFSSLPLETIKPETPVPTPTQLQALALTNEQIIEDPIPRGMILISFVIIFGVVIGSIFLQKPAKRPPPDDLFSGQV